MKIHLASDVHIEHGCAKLPQVGSDVVVLAGDVGLLHREQSLLNYLFKILNTTNNVVWVLGNHEFYGLDYHAGLDIANTIAENLGIHLLDVAFDRPSVEIDGVKFWGSTLWSDVKGGDYFVKQQVRRRVNDFYAIKHFKIDDMCEVNARTAEQIDLAADVIITHFPPVKIPDRFGFSVLSYYFYNHSMQEKLCNSKAKYWMFGHTHESYYDTICSDTILLSNPQAYDYVHSQYDPYLLIEV